MFLTKKHDIMHRVPIIILFLTLAGSKLKLACSKCFIIKTVNKLATMYIYI